MIQKSSNIVICQLDLINEIDNIERLIDCSLQELLSDILKQDIPLLLDIHVDNFAKSLKRLKYKLSNIKFTISEIK